MSIHQQEQPRGDIDNSGHESIKLEKNTKGYNWSVRVIAQEGETMDQMIDRLTLANNRMSTLYG